MTRCAHGHRDQRCQRAGTGDDDVQLVASPESRSRARCRSRVTMPRRPCWLAGCTNIAGVPVEASVARDLAADVCRSAHPHHDQTAAAAQHRPHRRRPGCHPDGAVRPSDRRGLDLRVSAASASTALGADGFGRGAIIVAGCSAAPATTRTGRKTCADIVAAVKWSSYRCRAAAPHAQPQGLVVDQPAERRRQRRRRRRRAR